MKLPEIPTPPTPKLVDSKMLCLWLGISGRQLERWIEAGTFPEPIRFGDGRNHKRFWRVADIEKLLNGSNGSGRKRK
jgi:hypothetical protein